jgi:hypothetical protein
LERIARNIPDPVRQTDMLVQLLRELGKAGEFERFEQVAQGIPDLGQQTLTLIELVGMFADVTALKQICRRCVRLPKGRYDHPHTPHGPELYGSLEW